VSIFLIYSLCNVNVLQSSSFMDFIIFSFQKIRTVEQDGKTIKLQIVSLYIINHLNISPASRTGIINSSFL
jgi:hypothetical protein